MGFSWDYEICPLHGQPTQFDRDGCESIGVKCLPCWRALAAWYWRLFPEWIGQNWRA